MTWVLVHGFTQTERSWNPIRGALADAVALRVPDDLTFVDTARALGDKGGRGTYVGYSMGGRLCLQLALDRPDLVERLVLVSASPGIADDAERAARRSSDETLAQDIERDGVNAFLDRWLAQPMFASLPADAAGLEERRAANTAARLTHQLRALGHGVQPSNWTRLADLAMPVMIAAGALDEKYTDLAHRMHECIGASAVVYIVDGAGHALHLERPEEFVHLLDSWSRTLS
jgi:2-succinyl-6-hydroxy-2,4-cyclohexadiene-1-carboxylate synthase